MKLKLIVAIFALATPALAHAQSSVPKPTKADAQNVVQIVTSDKVKTQAYCDLTKLEGEVRVAEQKKDTKDARRAQQTSPSAGRQAWSRILQIDGRIGGSRSEIQ